MEAPSAGDGTQLLLPKGGVAEKRSTFSRFKTMTKDTIISDSTPKSYLAFDYILVFPLPSATTEEDEERIRKNCKRNKKTHQSIMDSLIIHRIARGHEDFSIECGDSLKSMRNVAIEIFQSFFETLFDKDPDCKIVSFTSVDNDELFMCVKMSDKLMEQFADMADYPLQLDVSSLGKLGIKISDTRGVVPAFVRYDGFQKEHGMLHLFPKPESPNEKCLLRRVDRIRLIYDKLTHYIDLPEMEQLGLVSCFPCHNAATLITLRERWGTLCRCKVIFSLFQPIDDVRNYLGEGIAFYFLFVGTLAKATLFALMPVAVVFKLLCMYVFPPDSAGEDFCSSMYSVYLMAWFIGFNKHWRRTEAYYTNLWGMDRRPSHSEIHELMNPKFEGEMKDWPLDENQTVEEPIQSKVIVGWTISIAGQLLFILLIVISVSYTQYVAGEEDAKGHTSAQKLAAIAVSVQIQVFSLAWGYIASYLTDQEQHVTMAAWHESEARKIFLVGFFNTFFSFFYVGFFQQLVDPKSSVDSSDLLKTNMAIVYGTYVAFGVVDVVQPYIAYMIRVWCESRALRKNGNDGVQVSYLENQAKLSKYSGDCLASDYMQVCFGLAFVVMFSAVSPGPTVFLAFSTFVVQLRADAWKLLNTYRRAFPDMADGIGVWSTVMSALEIACIVVNVLLIITHFEGTQFVMGIPGLAEDLHTNSLATKVCIFFVALNFIFLCRSCFNYMVPDEPERVSLEKKRQDLQRQRLLEKEEDFKERATMWASGDYERSSFHTVPPLKPGDPFFSLMEV